jgi:FtsP/CotA-like multicopper oxidase with cupredoxin domain
MSFVYADDTVTGTPWTQPDAEPPTWTGPTDTLGHTWVLDEDMDAGIVTIDGESWPDVPMVDVTANVDTTFILDNESEMHHPFHIHGNRFQLVAVNGEPPEQPQGWKDTWDVPPVSTLTIVGALDNPGEWMYHCHILEHAEKGMAGMMTVSEAGDSGEAMAR